MVSEHRPDPAQPRSERPARPGRALSLLRKTALSLAVLLLLLIAGAAWIVGSESGANAAWSMLSARAPAMPRVKGLHGRLIGPLQLDQVVIDSADRSITLRDVRLDWKPAALLQRQLHVTGLRMARIDIANKIRKTTEPAKLPDSLALPLQLKIDQFQVDGGSIGWGPVKLAELGAFAFRLDYDGKTYRLGVDRLAVQSAASANPFSGALRGQLALASDKPYALNGEFSGGGQTTVVDRTVGASGRINLSGSLENMQADGAFAVSQMRQGAAQALGQVHGKLQLQLFSERPLGASDVNVQALDLALLSPGLPHTQLDAQLNAAADGSGELALTNADAGLLNEKKMPLSALQLHFMQSEGRFDFKRIAAELGSAALPAGSVGGNGRYANGALTLKLHTARLDAKRLDGRLRATRVAGDLEMRHANGKQSFSVSLAEPLKKNSLQLSAQAVLADDKISVEHAELRVGQSSLNASGEIGLAGSQRFIAQGKLARFRPQDLGEFKQLPALLLNGEFTLSGMRAPALQADLSFHIADSQVAGYALQGEGQAQLRKDRITVPQLLLAAGDNRLTMQGELAERNSRFESQLNFALHAPQLQQLGPAFGGALEASGSASGTLQAPHMSAEWNASGLRLPGQWRAELMQGKADIDIDRKQPFSLKAASIDASARGLASNALQISLLTAKAQFSPLPNAPLGLEVQAQGVKAGQLQAERISLNGKGTTAQHVLDAVLTVPPLPGQSAQSVQPAQTAHSGQRLALHASGGLQQLAKAPEWQGTIERFDADGRFAAHLAQPAPLRVSQQRAQLDRFRLDGDSALITVDQFVRDAHGMSSRGRFERLQVASLLRFTAPDPMFGTDLQLDGEWDVALADTLAGSVKIRRRQGDVMMRGSAPMALGLRTLEADANAGGGRLSVQLRAEGTRLGRVDLNAATTTASGARGMALAPDAPLSGKLRIDMPSIAWAGPLASPSLITEGRIQSAVTMAGTVDEPRLAGNISADGLRLFFTDSGVDLRHGTLQSEFQDTRLLISALRFPSAEGQLTISGAIDASGGEPSAQLTLNAQRFALLDRSDRKLVASGNSQFVVAGKQAKATGAFQIDSGFFDISRLSAPHLSDDVIVLGREKKAGGKMAAAVDLTVALGQNVILQGRGLNASLGGQLRLLNAAGELPHAQGTVRIVKGTYSAYGRELEIEHGALLFTGPVNNPSLDILAMRRNQEVEAGVSVRGTVLAPRVTLVSEPTVPDAEKLSWLVLGHGMSTAGGTDLSVLQSAAASLLSEGAQSGVQSQIANAFGLDTVSVSTSQDTLQQRIVTLGKQVSARLYVSYQQGLEAATSAVLLRYTLSRRVTLEAEAGTRSALSIFYNFSFD